MLPVTVRRKTGGIYEKSDFRDPLCVLGLEGAVALLSKALLHPVIKTGGPL